MSSRRSRGEEQLLLRSGRRERGDRVGRLGEAGRRQLAGAEQLEERDVVEVADLLRAMTLGPHPVHQALREPADHVAEQERDRHVPVLGRVHEAQVVRAESHTAGAPLDVGRSDRSGEHDALGGLHEGLLGRHVDVLPDTRAFAGRQGDDGRDRRFERRVVVRLRFADPHRSTIVVAGQHHLTAGRRDGQIAGQPVGLRSGLPERADGDGDERGVGGPQGAQVDVHGLAVEHDVGRGRQRDEIDTVDAHRALTPVVCRMEE